MGTYPSRSRIIQNSPKKRIMQNWKKKVRFNFIIHLKKMKKIRFYYYTLQEKSFKKITNHQLKKNKI